jgi:hypothetical protein
MGLAPLRANRACAPGSALEMLPIAGAAGSRGCIPVEKAPLLFRHPEQQDQDRSGNTAQIKYVVTLDALLSFPRWKFYAYICKSDSVCIGLRHGQAL